MLRRHFLAITCLALGGGFAAICAFIVNNMVQLAQAQSFAITFVHQAVDQGSHMPLPVIAPGAGPALSHERVIEILDQARQIGPFVAVADTACQVQSSSQNICAGQLMACMIEGTGASGAFQATLALCRGGDLAPYRLAASIWRFRFTNGDPLEDQDRSHL